MRRAAALLITLLALAGLAGCGGGGGGSEAVTLMLDFTPNPAHLGIYAAQAQGLYRVRGIDMKVEVPGESTDAPKLLAAGRVDFAVLDIHDLGIARENGLDLVAVAPILKFPLASILAPSNGPVKSPRDLEGRTVGVSGLPSDEAVVNAEVEAAGGNPSKVRRVTLGLNTIPALAAGKVDAITAFWKTDGFELQQRGVPTNVFKIEDAGAPVYPELVLATSQKTLENDPKLVRRVVRGTQEGYEFATEDLETAVKDLVAANPGLNRDKMQQEAFTFGPALTPGPFEPKVIREWAAWDLKEGILKQPLNVNEAFDFSIATY